MPQRRCPNRALCFKIQGVMQYHKDCLKFPYCKDISVVICLGGIFYWLRVGKQMLNQLLRAEHIIPVKCEGNLA